MILGNFQLIYKYFWWNSFAYIKYKSSKQGHMAIARTHRYIDFYWQTDSSNHCEFLSVILSVIVVNTFKRFLNISLKASQIMI